MLVRSRRITCFLISLTLLCAGAAQAQTDPAFVDGAEDPIKLFERGQDAHARGELRLALEFYEEAIKLRPEFPEAEYQRAAALVSLGDLQGGEKALRRAIELRGDWALPHASLGSLLARARRDREAEPALRRALELDPKNLPALDALADLRMRSGDLRESLELWRRATATKEANASHWIGRGAAERAAGDRAAALASFDRALAIDPDNISARLWRAEVRLEAGDGEDAVKDLRAIREAARSDIKTATSVASLYARANHLNEALQVLDALDEKLKKSPEVVALRNQLTISGDGGTEERAALEQLLEREPRNAALLARLGALYRTDDPARALEFYQRAVEFEPGNADYATGYAAALVQARRFADAVLILRRVIAARPDNYPARANLATALYELKRYREALIEYDWLVETKPDLAVAYYFIATAHDVLGEFDEALAAYEKFLARADAQQNQLEIEKVNLRLPSLRNQIRLGQGAKRKKRDQ